MLDDFVPEVPVVQLPHQPVELAGFDSEVRRGTLRPVTARAQWKWPRMSTGSVVLTAVCVGAGLTLGTLASSIGHAPAMPGDKSNPQLAVSAGETLVALSPEQFSTDPPASPAPDAIAPVGHATAA